MVYTLDANLNVIPSKKAVAPLRGEFLGDAAEIAAKKAEVADQINKK